MGNVRSITNTGAAKEITPGKGIGGSITHNYFYDNLYRLETANGTFNGYNGKMATYSLEMGYDNMHNITKKKQDVTQTGIQFAGTLKAGYDLNYTINAGNSQQISNIAENSYRTEGTGAITPMAKSSQYSYDANGNLIYTVTGTVNNNKLQATKARKLLWDEENRLLGVSDNGFVSQYWYDAAGERTVKESFDNEGVYVNGALSGARTGTTKYTAYISPYLVLNNGGNYTKHIYIGSQRITSKLFNSTVFTGETPISDDPAMGLNFKPKYNLQTEGLKAKFDSLGVKFNGTLYNNQSNTVAIQLLDGGGPSFTPESYFYHPDHLGSSSLITNQLGDLVQHIQYVPFGEVFVEERNATWSTPYKFNGKEQDEETGLSYYGARYYDPRTSVWLSVDPLVEKYPNVSSYVYCLGNPVNLIDPDGQQPRGSRASSIALGWFIPPINATTPGQIMQKSGLLGKIGHAGLDGVGMVPLIGEFADGFNGLIYLFEKDFQNAGFGLAAMVPFAGWASVGVKYGLKVTQNIGGKFVKFGIKNIDEYYSAVSKLSTQAERITAHIEVFEGIAKKSNWEEATSIMKKNPGRNVYKDDKGLLYSLDKQHGEIEILNKRGKHLGSVKFDGTNTGKGIQPNHDLKVK